MADEPKKPDKPEPRYNLDITLARGKEPYSEWRVMGVKGGYAYGEKIFHDPGGLFALDAALRSIRDDAAARGLEFDRDRDVRIRYIDPPPKKKRR